MDYIFRKFLLPALCAIPSVPGGNIIRLSGHCNGTHCPLNRAIAIRCGSNYILIRYGVLQCAGYGEWDHPLPTCQSKKKKIKKGLMSSKIFFKKR